MGLLTTDVKRAEDCLNAYMMPIGNSDDPFVFHGTPLPTQIFLYAAIFSKTSDVEFLKEFYPLIYKQSRFFAVRILFKREKSKGKRNAELLASFLQFGRLGRLSYPKALTRRKKGG